MPVTQYSFTPRARRELRRAPADVARRIVEAIRDYVADARTGDVRKLAGVEEAWRLRVGDWRVRFRYSEDGRTLMVLHVLPRGRAYRD